MKEVVINPADDIEFELKVVEACRSCKRFGKKSSCPPSIPSVDYYRELLPKYRNGLLVYAEFSADKSEWEKIGKLSSLTIQKYLLKKRDELFSEGHYFATAFGSGSCKICPECTFPCKFPNKSLVPLEATGVNVVKLAAKYNINVEFPVSTKLYRIGLLLWD